ncbi:MAG: hypothetical protein J0M18_20415 [Ignavibacteria bacterium]|nr:hypothetical protein [Ignavibacteria bacterium]
MKFILPLIFILSFFSCCSAQSDTIALNTPNIFKITYLNPEKKEKISFTDYSTYNEVYLDTLTKDFLIIEHKSDTYTLISRKSVRVLLKDITELGYVKGDKSVFGALLGMGIGTVSGVILGALAEKQDKLYDKGSNRSVGTSIAIGFVCGTGLGYLLGGIYNNYETSELSRYDNDLNKKYLKILSIIQRGIQFNKNN